MARWAGAVNMSRMSNGERQVCPACGGAGGGPFGRANSGWDVETYECPRCEGWGYIREVAVATAEEAQAASVRPGIAKATPERPATETPSRRASSRR